MRHECTCGHTLAPQDLAEPVDAISHGICARCYAKALGARKPFWYPVRLNGYEVRLLVRPERGEPHVSYDSPRKWEGPRPIRVIEQRVYTAGGVELDPAEFRDLLSEARGRANLPGGNTGRSRPVFSRQMQLRLSGHLRRAMERTGYVD